MRTKNKQAATVSGRLGLSRRRGAPVGVFDSGLGGLTVVKEIRRTLPHEDIVYFGDTARVPYGTKSRASIIHFSHDNAKILLKYGVKMIVVACNSSSSFALPQLKKFFKVPVLGVIRPGARTAVATTKNKRIGIIATAATIQSKSYDKQVHREDLSVKVFSQPCPLFVPLVEEGWMNKPVTLTVAKMYLSSLRKARIDTLILGCTHYPLLKRTLSQALGPKVTLIDSAREVAQGVKDLLEGLELNSLSTRTGRSRFLVSDKPQAFEKIAKNFLGHSIHAKLVAC